ncbi:MAG: hypothetical protein ABI321_21610 [Polyangia bacterium]
MIRTGVTAALLVLAGVAYADRIAALPPRLSGTSDAATTLAEEFRTSLEGGLTTAGHDVVLDSQVDAVLRKNPTLAACDTDVCFQKLGQLVGARAVMRTAVEVLGSSNYEIRMELHDVTQPHTIVAVEDACTICTVREANDAMSRAAAEVGRRFRAPTQVAPVRVVEHVAAAPGAAKPVMTSSSGNGHSKLFLGLGVAAMVLGAGGVGAGAYLIATDGQHDSAGNDVAGNPLESTRHSLVAGAVITSAGALLLAGGAVLLWRSHVEKQRAHR